MITKEYSERKNIRLRNYDYSKAGFYFITICSLGMESIFGDIRDGKIYLNELGKLVARIWMEIPNHYSNATIDEFIVMPNHFHGILVLNEIVETKGAAVNELGAGVKDLGAIVNELGAASSAPTVAQILRRFKSTSAIAVNRHSKREGRPLWQRNYYEHIIRNNESYVKIAEYILTNPKRWENDVYFIL